MTSPGPKGSGLSFVPLDWYSPQMTADLVLDGLAVYRLARLITVDDITEPLRQRATDWLVGSQHHRAAELINCGYCVSVWTAFGVVFVAPRVVPGWQKVRLALAAAGVAAVLFDFMKTEMAIEADSTDSQA
jgi:hypothetical protein